MNLPELLERYGYAAVLVGTFFEGETILIMAGFAAHNGRLSLPWVMVAAFVGSFAGDQTAFLAGRRYGEALLARFARLRPGVERAGNLLRRFQAPLLLGFRFVYGIRVATPIAAALAKVPALRFVVLNALGAALWSVVVSAAGYLFGSGLSRLLQHAKRFEHLALLAIALLGLGIWIGTHWRRRSRSSSP